MAAAIARAQDPGGAPPEKDKKPPAEDITVNINVNHGFAYRPNTWVSVDLLVLNTKKDISGWLELRAYAGEDLESPIYRVPLESPKDSHKHFQVTCRLRTTTSRLSVQLYNGRRAVLDYPTFLDINPIDERDILSLVLDQDGAGFGFLNNVAEAFYEEYPRFYRETVTPETIGFLSTRLQCYTPFDLVVFGKMDLARLGKPQREALTGYVRQGGRIVFCTGEYAERCHDVWMQSLACVAVGAKEVVKEGDMARALFSEADAKGARADRDIFFAELKPTDPGVKTLAATSANGGRILATRRALGGGFVYTLAVDADGHAFQECPGFLKIWDEISRRRTGGFEINRQACKEYIAQAMPRLCGVVVHPRSSVMIYLGLYGLAVGGNWLLFNRLKRREWSWATLVLLSGAFTLYAVFFGTSGRATQSEINQVHLLRLAAHEGQPSDKPVLAEQTALVAMLTPHTSTQTVRLLGNSALADDATLAQNLNNRYSFRMQSRPFTFAEEETPRIEGLRLGASDLRVVEIDDVRTIPGPITGTIQTNDREIQYSIQNRSGLEFSECYLYVHGQFLQVTVPPREGAYEGHTVTSPSSYGTPGDYATFDGKPLFLAADEFRGPAGLRSIDAEQLTSQLMPEFRKHVMAHAVQGSGTNEGSSRQPLLCAWVNGPAPDIIQPEKNIRNNISQMLVFAPLQWAASSTVTTHTNLPILLETANAMDASRGVQVTCGSTIPCHIVIPKSLLEDADTCSLRFSLDLKHAQSNVPPDSLLQWEPDLAKEQWVIDTESTDAQGTTRRARDFEELRSYVLQNPTDIAADIPLETARKLEGTIRRLRTRFPAWAELAAPDGFKAFKIISGTCRVGGEDTTSFSNIIRAHCTLSVSKQIGQQGESLPWQ